MIVVCVEQDAEGIRMMDVSGHAMQAPHGEDLVCAGVSCIMTGALNALDELVPQTCDLAMQSGYISIRMKEADQRTRLLLAAVLIQLRTMEAQFSQYMKITVQEV